MSKSKIIIEGENEIELFYKITIIFENNIGKNIVNPYKIKIDTNLNKK